MIKLINRLKEILLQLLICDDAEKLENLYKEIDKLEVEIYEKL